MGKRKEHRIRLNILAVDDSPDILEIIDRNLSEAGYAVMVSSSVEEAVDLLENRPIDLVITDLKMPKASGLDLIKHVRENFKDVEIIMITGYPSISGAVEAIRDGAAEYLVKPFTHEELLRAVRKVTGKISHRRVLQEKTPPEKTYGIIGTSPGMRTVFKRIEKAASTTANVLISGESGTGKELVARAIHYSSDRRSAPFFPVNCTAIPDTLLESELFGHVKGAFTGANNSRAGFFQIADGGTIFLDEIGDASLNMQGKLLRVLESKEIQMVGSSRFHKVDTRILAATNKNLMELIKKGLFREDLYYRLNVIDVLLPSLRERGADILLLVDISSTSFQMK